MRFLDFLIVEKESEHPLNWKCTKCGRETPEPTEKYKEGTVMKKHCPVCNPYSKIKKKHTITW